MNDKERNTFRPDADNLDAVFSDCCCHGGNRDLQFEACTFERCDFSRAQFVGGAFVDCRFADSDLTMTEFTDSTFNGVVFERCRLRGVDWTSISDSLLSLEFHGCVLDYGSFDGLKLKRTPFRKCSAVEATFDEADLRESDFNGSTLTKASFARPTFARPTSGIRKALLWI